MQRRSFSWLPSTIPAVDRDDSSSTSIVLEDDLHDGIFGQVLKLLILTQVSYSTFKHADVVKKSFPTVKGMDVFDLVKLIETTGHGKYLPKLEWITKWNRAWLINVSSTFLFLLLLEMLTGASMKQSFGSDPNLLSFSSCRSPTTSAQMSWPITSTTRRRRQPAIRQRQPIRSPSARSTQPFSPQLNSSPRRRVREEYLP